MKTGKVYSGSGNQSDQPGNKIQWLKYDMRGAIAPRCSPKAPTFGLIHSEADHCGSVIVVC